MSENSRSGVPAGVPAVPGPPGAPLALEQMPGEPDKWYDFFCRYKLLGPRRTFLNTYRAVLAEEGKPTRNSLPGAWVDASRKFHWRRRATLWDRRQRDLDAAELQDRRAELKEKRITALSSHLDKVVEAIKNLEPGGADYRSVSHALGVVCREMRAELAPTGGFNLDAILGAMPADMRIMIVAALRTGPEVNDEYSQELDSTDGQPAYRLGPEGSPGPPGSSQVGQEGIG